MISKAKIARAIDNAYQFNNLEYVGVCDGGKHGQVVCVQAYAQHFWNNPKKAKSRVYIFYGYDRYKAGKRDGQIVWDSYDEETWKQIYFDKASAIEFAREILNNKEQGA